MKCLRTIAECDNGRKKVRFTRKIIPKLRQTQIENYFRQHQRIEQEEGSEEEDNNSSNETSSDETNYINAGSSKENSSREEEDRIDYDFVLNHDF